MKHMAEGEQKQQKFWEKYATYNFHFCGITVAGKCSTAYNCNQKQKINEKSIIFA